MLGATLPKYRPIKDDEQDQPENLKPLRRKMHRVRNKFLCDLYPKMPVPKRYETVVISEPVEKEYVPSDVPAFDERNNAELPVSKLPEGDRGDREFGIKELGGLKEEREEDKRLEPIKTEGDVSTAIQSGKEGEKKEPLWQGRLRRRKKKSCKQNGKEDRGQNLNR